MDRRRQMSVKRCQGDQGSALVEMAFILVPLSLMLFAGFVATGVGRFVECRQRMRKGARVRANQPQAGFTINTVTRKRAMKRHDLEGACL